MDKILHLRRSRLLATLSDQELSRVGEVAHHQRLPRRQLVFAAGEPGEAVYLLKEGRVRLYMMSPEGKEMTLAIIEPGDWFGETAVAGGTRNVYAETLEPATICAISRPDFLKIIAGHPDLALEVAGQLGRRLDEVAGRLGDMVFKDVTGRLVTLLLEWAHKRGVATADGLEVQHGLTHQEIANLIGTTRETLTLTLSRLTTDGLIRTDRGVITILDRDRLAELVTA